MEASENKKPAQQAIDIKETVEKCDGKCVLFYNGMGDEVCTRCGFDSMIPSGYD